MNRAAVAPGRAAEPRGARTAGASFRERFCRLHGCPDREFQRQVFWRSIFLHARIVALFAGRGADCFAVDRALIDYCGRLTALGQIDAELAEFRSLANRSFLRRRLRLRVSGRRLRRLAAACFAR